MTTNNNEEEETPIVEEDEFSFYSEEPSSLDVEEATIEPKVPAEPAVPAEPVEKPAPAETPVEPTYPTPEDLQKAVEAGLAKSAAVVEPEPEELTQEEIDEALKVAKYTIQDLKDLGMVDDDTPAEKADAMVATFGALMQRQNQQAVATAQLLMQHQMGQMNQQYTPLMEAHKRQQNDSMKNAFYEKYETLKEHEEIVKVAATQAMQGGQLEGKSFDEVSEIIATSATSLIEKYSGTKVNLATQKSPAAPVRTEVPKPSQVTTGGRNQEAKPKPAGTPDEFDIYDE